MNRFLLTTQVIILAAISGWFSTAVFGDDIYYTRVGFRYEKDTHLATNYLRGTYVPFNTEVSVTGKSGKVIKIQLVGSGQAVVIKNVPNHTSIGVDQLFERMFSKEKLDEQSFSRDHLGNIKGGVVTPGMTRQEVLAAIGYPPAHQTPSIESDQWRYWQHRFNTMVVHFSDGRVAKIER